MNFKKLSHLKYIKWSGENLHEKLYEKLREAIYFGEINSDNPKSIGKVD